MLTLRKMKVEPLVGTDEVVISWVFLCMYDICMYIFGEAHTLAVIEVQQIQSHHEVGIHVYFAINRG